MSRRVAALDCGTNSLRLLVAEIDPGRGELTDLARRMEIVRLGQGVDQTGRLAPEALARTIGVLREYATVIDAAAVSAVRMVATSASRDADNSAEFVGQVKDVLGIAPEVLTGTEEAMLAFTGATAELGGHPDDAPYLVADIGGGSTEFVLGPAGPGGPPVIGGPGGYGGAGSPPVIGGPGGYGGAGSPPVIGGPGGYGGAGSPPVIGGFRGVAPPDQHSISVNIGCVRLTERHLHGDPPGEREVTAAIADIDAALDRVSDALPVRDARTLVGLAGSVTTVAAIALGLPGYDAARIHHARVAAADVHAVTRDLLAQTRAARAEISVMHPGRVDVIGGGALVLDRVMQRFGFAEVLVSEHDILDGIAWSLARDGQG